jgi:hypothetical protein
MKMMSRQRGVVLLLILLSVMAIGGAALLITMGNSISQQSRIVPETIEKLDMLQGARLALLGYSIGVNAGGTRPGQMPRPDHASDGNYDGQADDVCISSTDPSAVTVLSGTAMNTQNLRCVGRLPWKSLGLNLAEVGAQDSIGAIPWYVVSQNLADADFCMKILNPGTIAMPSTSSFVCPVSDRPAWPWLKVCDSKGRVISDRVAIVLIAPGVPIQTEGRMQTRLTLSTDPRNFLDAVPAPSGWAELPIAQRCSSFDNANLSNEFIMADISASFNDRISYITIDELMEYAERRVVGEVREAIIAYRNSTGGYPWLASLGPTGTANTATLAVPGTLSGLVPFYPKKSTFKFLTEVSWSLSGDATADTLSGSATASPTFFCYDGYYQCRLRTVAASPSAIPRTITSALLRVNSIATPTVSCLYSYSTTTPSYANKVDCDEVLNYETTTSVSYTVQRRACLFQYVFCSGGYTSIGQYAGTQRQLTSVDFGVTQGSGIPTFTQAGVSTTSNRVIVSAAAQPYFLGGSIVRMSHSWRPQLVGSAPFDISGGPFLAWNGSVGGNGVITIRTRAHPELPSWYESERWYEFLYAAISPDASPSSGVSSNCSANCFSAGSKSNLDAVVISAGATLVSQDRILLPAPVTSNFLESKNSTGVTTRLFEDVQMRKNSSYADTVATIPR